MGWSAIYDVSDRAFEPRDDYDVVLVEKAPGATRLTGNSVAGLNTTAFCRNCNARFFWMIKTCLNKGNDFKNKKNLDEKKLINHYFQITRIFV